MSRPMSGWPPSTMQAMPSRLAMANSSAMRSTSCMKKGPVEAGGAGGGPPRPAGGGALGGRVAAWVSAAYLMKRGRKSGGNDMCSWKSVAPPASSSGA